MPTQSVGKGSSEASIDQVNIWMRSTPWYQQQLRAWGQDPGHPTLSKNQSQQILRMAQANGVQVDEGQIELDNHGNLNPIGHKLRNTLVVAGLAGATIATMGAAGAFSGAAAAGAGAGTGVGGGALASDLALETAAGIGGGVAGGGGAAGAGAAGWFTSAGGLSLGKTLLGIGADVYGANKQADASKTAAQLQIDAANHAADVQAEALKESARLQALGVSNALDWTKQQAEGDWQNSEIARSGNYDQWAAGQRRLGTLGEQIGMGAREIPAYRPSQNPNYGGSGSGGGSGGVAPDPATGAAIRAALQHVNSSDDPTYWDRQIAAHGDSSAKNWDYWAHRIAIGDGVGKGYQGAAAPPTAPAAPPKITTQPVLASLGAPLGMPPIAPGLPVPPAAYRPDQLGDFLGMA